MATDFGSRGMNFPDVAYVINFDLPTEKFLYVHRIGRTGRLGKDGQAISFFDPYNPQNCEYSGFFVKVILLKGKGKRKLLKIDKFFLIFKNLVFF